MSWWTRRPVPLASWLPATSYRVPRAKPMPQPLPSPAALRVKKAEAEIARIDQQIRDLGGQRAME